MSVASETRTLPAAWLRAPSFDLGFILGIAAVALISGLVAVQVPEIFPIVFLANIWLLGYHHVISTYTRLCFDRESFLKHRFLIFGVPPLLVAGTGLLAYFLGLWALASLYLYWQWFHYTRQSWGIAQIYRRKAGGITEENEHLSKIAFYLLPLWGILHRSYQDPGSFLGLELKVIPVPELAVDLVGIAAVAAFAWWLISRATMLWKGRLPLAHTLYLLSHYAIFYVGYLMIDDINAGWLVINIWHNAQYIAIVWLYNNNRYKDGIDPKAIFLSTISQTRNAWRYLLVCFAISSLLYLGLNMAFASLAILVVIYQIINFHHYIVDGVIWKVRRKGVGRHFGIATSR
ncbi:MAG: hypothetical protein V3V17_10530 [Alphaproteobacteria bacterium]